MKSNLFLAALFLQIVLIFTIIFDIDVARQVIGFVYLTFVPGFAILGLLRLKLGKVEMTLFMVGLSLAFLMLEGFLLNSLGPLLGFSQPLDLTPILVVTSVFVVFSLFLRRDTLYEPITFNVGFKHVVIIGFLLSSIIGLSIFGGTIVNLYPATGNIILFVMLFSIALIIGLAAFSKKIFPPQFYPLILFVVALALLFHTTLFSRSIVGSDIFGEFSLFKNTIDNFRWDVSGAYSYNAMLSVTILPTIYSLILKLDGTWIFKIIYPLIFATVPVGLYQLFKNKVTKEIAVFSVFFFVANIAFYIEIAQLARQMIGEIFYILLFIVLFSERIKGTGKLALFTIFSFGLVVSHYSLAYIFLASLIVVWLVSIASKHMSKITFTMILLFGIIAFAWFIYVSSGSTFNNFIITISRLRNSFLSDFFNPQARSNDVLQAVGASGIPTLWHSIGRYQFYITEAFVIVGIVSLLIKNKMRFFKDDFNVLVLFNLLLLVACIVIPNFAGSFNVSRFYHVTLFVLAPFCLIGGVYLLKLLSKQKIEARYLSLAVVLLVLIPFFFFQTGAIYEIAKDESASLPLSGYRFGSMQLASMGVLNDPEVSGATWLLKFGNNSTPVYADIYSDSIFTYVGSLSRAEFTPDVPVNSSSYVYLMPYNIATEEITLSYGSYLSTSIFNASRVTPSYDRINTIYSSGSCEIFQVP